MKTANEENTWEVWHQDTFDRETPRRVEISGEGLVEGLVQLWARHLFETVQAGGGRGFSRFNLWWKNAQRSIEVDGDWEGQVRIRRWIYGGYTTRIVGYEKDGNLALLRKIAEAHRSLILRGKTGQEILLAAGKAADPDVFDRNLSNLLVG